MHVGVNLIYLVPGETGGLETYARELIPALLAERPGLRLTAFINREAAEVRDGPWHDIPHVLVPVRARNRVNWVRGEQHLLPRLATAAGVELLHSLASTAPAWGKFRRVVTIHDLIYRLYPEAHFGARAMGMRVLVPLAARRSSRVIVPSRSTRDDVVGMLGVSESKVDIVPQGIGAVARSAGAPERDVRVRHRLGERQVLLTVSAKRPHKNLDRLIDAMALIPGHRRPVLVLPGYATPHERELATRIARKGVQDHVRLVGWVSAEELEGLYEAAACFVFPSLYEGFGLPVLEAMARGVPVACSNRASLAEVAAGAARLFDPESTSDIAATVEAILNDPTEAARLRELGLRQAAKFSWEATAHGTLASYERALAAE